MKTNLVLCFRNYFVQFTLRKKSNNLNTNYTYQGKIAGSEFLDLRIILRSSVNIINSVHFGDYLALYKNILFYENAETSGKHQQ